MKNFLILGVLSLMVGLIGCDKVGDTDAGSLILSSADQTLFYGDEFQIEATSSKAISYTSENEYHAIVSQTGLVTAKRVGETNIVLSDGEIIKRLKITVKPQSNLYPEPNIEWGISRASLISRHGTPNAESEITIGYDDYSPNAPIVMYMFDDNNKLKSLCILVKTAYSSQLGTFLGERYVPFTYSSDDYSIGFVNGTTANTITMGIGASIYNLSYWMVIYFPFSATRNGESIDHSQTKAAIDELMSIME